MNPIAVMFRRDRWGKLRFKAGDLFQSTKWIGTTNQPDINLHTGASFRFAERTFMLSWTNTFGNKKLKSARKLAHKEGPIAHVLSRMNEEGYWQRPGTGYGPKYKSTVWALILLAQLGASMQGEKRIRLACSYYLDHRQRQS